jgi:hypothetical protein
MKKFVPTILFLVICFCIGYFGVQKFESKKLFWLGGALFLSGAFGLAIQHLPEKKVKPTPRRNVTSL